MAEDQNIDRKKLVSKIEKSMIAFNKKVRGIQLRLSEVNFNYEIDMSLECVSEYPPNFQIGQKVKVTNILGENVVIDDLITLNKEIVHIYFR